MRWKFLFALITALVSVPPSYTDTIIRSRSKDDTRSIKVRAHVEIRGTLRHTATGTFVDTYEDTSEYAVYRILDEHYEKTWALDFGQTKDLQEVAAKLNGKTVIVKGTTEVHRVRVSLPNAPEWSLDRKIAVTGLNAPADK